MRFKTLQDNLRKAMWKRIDERALTGLKLAKQTGFKQAHISNFLNRKRSLSLEGMDKVLQVQKLSVLDLLDPEEVNQRATAIAPAEGAFENVPLVESEVAAADAQVTAHKVKDILQFKKGFLKRLRPDPVPAAREHWRRFVLIKVDGRDGMSMYPRLLPGATVLIDRHYISLKPYRKHEQNMYAVKKEGACTIKYVERAGKNLVLRPHNQNYPVDVITVAEGKSYSDYIVGRVCHVAIET